MGLSSLHRSFVLRLVGWLLIGVAAGCATAAPPAAAVVAPPAPPAVEIPAAAPADLYITERPPAIVRAPWWRWAQGHVLYPTQQMLDVTRVARTLTGRPRPGIDMVEDYVVNSSFFTNREIAAQTPEQIRWGAAHPSEEPRPPFVVEGIRASGRVPGCFVVDARGDHYRFTVDFLRDPEIATAADVVTGKLLHALGYNVLPSEIYLLNPADVQIGVRPIPDLPEYAPATAKDVEHLLAPRANAQGRVRVAATKLPDESTVVSCFSYKRYQHYAALRALAVAYGWLDNIDAGELQTLMTWDGHIAKGYLIDFGSSLNSDVHRQGVKAPAEPYDPERWSPAESNVAFDQLTDAEAQWMARRIAAFSIEQLVAAVSAARVSRPEAANALLAMLQARQTAIRRRYVEGESAVVPPAPPATDVPAPSVAPPAPSPVPPPSAPAITAPAPPSPVIETPPSPAAAVTAPAPPAEMTAPAPAAPSAPSVAPVASQTAAPVAAPVASDAQERGAAQTDAPPATPSSEAPSP